MAACTRRKKSSPNRRSLGFSTMDAATCFSSFIAKPMPHCRGASTLATPAVAAVGLVAAVVAVRVGVGGRSPSVKRDTDRRRVRSMPVPNGRTLLRSRTTPFGLSRVLLRPQLPNEDGRNRRITHRRIKAVAQRRRTSLGLPPAACVFAGTRPRTEFGLAGSGGFVLTLAIVAYKVKTIRRDPAFV